MLTGQAVGCMKLGFVKRKTAHQWGGDLAAMDSLCAGLKELGVEVQIGTCAAEVGSCDFILLFNASLDLKEDCAWLQAAGKRFGVIGFYDNRSRHYSYCCGFVHCVTACLQGSPFYRLEQLYENPEIATLFSYEPPPVAFDFLRGAEICIATSKEEALWMEEDFPGCRTEVLYLDSGISKAEVENKSRAFLEWTGLSEGEYVLQVGRIEMRKNQLASLLAMRDEPMPLVFIATQSFNAAYEKMVLEMAAAIRRAPTLVISQTLHEEKRGSLRVIRMPGGEKLPRELLLSAYQNAGLHLHPAFCELPGLTYLESAQLGVPTVASAWATIKEYFIDPNTNAYTLDDRIAYALPYHIPALTELVREQFGKKVDKTVFHPAFQRTKKEVAAMVLSWIGGKRCESGL